MHTIIHETYPELYTQKQITNEVLNTVARSGDRYGTNKVQFPTEKVFDNREAAEDYISSIDKGFYGGYAVKFYDFSAVTDSQKVKELRKKIAETVQKKDEYIKAHSVKTQKAAYIGCSCCGSKLSKERLRSERCPLCNTDLRAASTLERIASFDKRVKEYSARIEQEQLKDKKKAKVKWLVKYEYHC